MGSLESVRQKLHRAHLHIGELERELRSYYETDPSELVEASDSTPNVKHIIFVSKDAIPARMGLICGDSLQCLRSSLDYLVWELALVCGGTPNMRNMFPVALSESSFLDDVIKRKRLQGLSKKAIEAIDSVQPYKAATPEESPLAVLEELTNINKHRRILLTNLTGGRQAPPVPFPHMQVVIRNINDLGNKVMDDVTMWGYLTIDDGVTKGVEITVTLNALSHHIRHQVLPLFESFFW